MTTLLQWLDPEVAGKIALLLFCILFVAVAIYAWTRTARQVEDWSRIPLGDDGRDHEFGRAVLLHGRERPPCETAAEDCGPPGTTATPEMTTRCRVRAVARKAIDIRE
ncbi:MAG: cbb3-type cytochrome c oxidase subunit 3 [Tepidisphaerales bacterium]